MSSNINTNKNHRDNIGTKEMESIALNADKSLFALLSIESFFVDVVHAFISLNKPKRRVYYPVQTGLSGEWSIERIFVKYLRFFAELL